MSPPRRRRKPAAPSKGKQRKRDYRAEYARRQAKAKREGFASYYDRRVRAGDVTAPRPKGETLRRRRGHAAGRDLVDAAREGDLLVAQLNRDAKGRFRSIDVTLIHEDGSEVDFVLRGRQLDPAYLRGIEDELADAGVAQSYGYPIRNVVDMLEEEEGNSAPPVRKRDYRAEYARRQAKAKREGFASYYDRRVRAGDLRAARPKGETLRRLRGHAVGAETQAR